MIHAVILPMLGETMDKGIIVSWLKSEGEQVDIGEPIFEVETDKATIEVEANESGYMRKIIVPEGSEVQVLSVLGIITTEPDENIEDFSQTRSELTPTSPESPPLGKPPMSRDDSALPVGAMRIMASPRARKLAISANIDLLSIEGTGPNGRIVERDVRAVTSYRDTADEGESQITVSPVAVRVAAELGLDPNRVQGSGRGGRVTRKDIEKAVSDMNDYDFQAVSRVHRLMADRMTASFTTAPHFYLHAEVDASQLVNLRKAFLEELGADLNVHITITDLLIYYVAKRLPEYPKMMAQWADDGLRVNNETNIGLAVDTAGGLIVPVIRDADKLGLIEIAQLRSDLVERAQTGSLQLTELENGVITITNLGMFRIDSFDAILNPPQAAILAIGRIKDRPLAVNGALVVAPTMHLSLSLDHRVIDGAYGARFLGDLTRIIENPGMASVHQ